VAARNIGSAGGLTVDGVRQAYTEEVWSGVLSVGLPVLRTASLAGDVSFAYNVDHIRNLDGVPVPDPDQAITRRPEVGTVAGLTMRVSLSNARRSAFSVGQIDGRQVSASLRLNDPDLGSDFRSLELTYRWSEYLQMPWATSQTVALSLRGGLEETDRSRDGVFGLGGLPDQNVARAIVDSSRVSTSVLRGYEPGKYRGRQFHLLNAEYRVRFGDLEEGQGTLPFFFKRMHAAVLVDAGFASDQDFAWDLVRPTLGAALRLDAIFGWYEGGTFELGWAKGLAADGRHELWFLLTSGQ
jgi:hypothetical protein